MDKKVIDEVKSETAVAVLRMLSEMAGKERDSGNSEGEYATNRAWHAVNDKKWERFYNGP
jgi:hypothetical protein